MSKVLVKEFKLGTIEYRMPNIVETMKLLGQLGMSRKAQDPVDGQEFLFISKLIDNMKPMILTITAIKGDQLIETWEEALEHMEFMAPLSEISAEILAHVSPSQDADEKN